MVDRCEGRRGGLPIVSEVARQHGRSCTMFSTMSVFFSTCAHTLASVFSDPMCKRWRPPSMERTYRASTMKELCTTKTKTEGVPRCV